MDATSQSSGSHNPFLPPSDILISTQWGRTEFELGRFCTGLRHSSLAERTRVISLRRYAAMGKVLHRFLLFEAIRDGIRLCIRLDRYPRIRNKKGFLGSTYSPASDSVLLSLDEHLLVGANDRREAVIHFGDPVPFSRFGSVFDVVRNESMFYSINKQNCWFFASIIQELAVLFLGGRFNPGSALNQPQLGKRCRISIKTKVYDVLHVSASIRDLEPLVFVMQETSLIDPGLRLLRIMEAQDRLLHCSSLSDVETMHDVAFCLKRMLSSWKDVVYEHLHASGGVPGARKLGPDFPRALSQILKDWEAKIRVSPERTKEILRDGKLGMLEQMLRQLFTAQSSWVSIPVACSRAQASQFEPSTNDHQPSDNSEGLQLALLPSPIKVQWDSQAECSNLDFKLALWTLEGLSLCQSIEILARKYRFRLNKDIIGLRAQVSDVLPASSLFACRSWSMLVCRVHCRDADIIQALEKFVENWLPHWVATMGVMGELDAACLSLHRVVQWMQPRIDKNELLTRISSMYRFILRYKQALSQSSFFILNGALPFSHSACPNGVGSSPSDQSAPYSAVLFTAAGHAQHSWGQFPMQLRNHPGPVSSIAFSPDGDRIVSACRQKAVWIWSATTGTLSRVLNLDSVCVSAVFSPDGTQIACALEDTSQIYICHAESRPDPIYRRLRGHSKRVNSLSFSPYGLKLASGSGDKTIRIWDCQDGGIIKTLYGHIDAIASVDYSRDGVLLVSASYDRTICIWDAANGNRKRQINLGSAIYSVSFTADDSRVIFAANDGSIGVLCADGWEDPRIVGMHDNAAYAVSCSAIGSRIASGSADKSVRLWNAMSGTHVRTINGHVGKVYSVAFSPDNKRVASGSRDRSVRIWDVEPPTRADMIGNSFIIASSLDGKQYGHLRVLLFRWSSTRLRVSRPDCKGHISYSPCGRVLRVRGWGVADTFEQPYTLYLNPKDLKEYQTPIPSVFPPTSPDPSLPIVLDQNCLCVQHQGVLSYVCWLPDDFEPISEVVQIGRRVTVGGKGGEVIHVDFKELDLGCQ